MASEKTKPEAQVPQLDPFGIFSNEEVERQGKFIAESAALNKYILGSHHAGFKAGNAYCLMLCLSDCLENDWPIPEWVKQEIIGAVDKVQEFKVRSWDEALGKPHAKGTHFPTARKIQKNGLAIATEIKKRSNAGAAIDTEMLEAVATQFNTNRDFVSEMWKIFKPSSAEKKKNVNPVRSQTKRK
jgi:hypothetical protein